MKEAKTILSNECSVEYSNDKLVLVVPPHKSYKEHPIIVDIEDGFFASKNAKIIVIQTQHIGYGEQVYSTCSTQIEVEDNKFPTSIACVDNHSIKIKYAGESVYYEE